MQLCNFFALMNYFHFDFEIINSKVFLRKSPNIPRVLKPDSFVFLFESAHPVYKRQYQYFEFYVNFFPNVRKFKFLFLRKYSYKSRIKNLRTKFKILILAFGTGGMLIKSKTASLAQLSYASLFYPVVGRSRPRHCIVCEHMQSW